ncbi:rna polymerase i specific transcription initiation factor [Ophiostoma piceae UAMH 11346]|uniref:Rna polymerase i specific transcription initiation factor n=1 Tax=Ophiostoma piceae (strain UAMH 11346) TaxID=1262450 RepID=S3CC71_OPHP1|nr:rna polymerase i specific transcription initiation factor [Ophiostoma piceae UAMH 11346]
MITARVTQHLGDLHQSPDPTTHLKNADFFTGLVPADEAITMSQVSDSVVHPRIRSADDRPLKKRRRANLGNDIDEPLEDDDQDDRDDDWVAHDTASIATIDSERLSTTRPNRWRGSARQWNHLTGVDRAVVSALHRTRDGDLAAHLYDVFQVKKQITAEEQRKKKNGNEATEDDSVWNPKPYWTAWPLRARFNPGVFTRSTPYRRKHHTQRVAMSPRMRGKSAHSCSQFRAGGDLFSGPSGPLAEMVTAVILRVAREQFQQRQKVASRADGSSKALLAVVSSDDGVSEEILQPTVRHLLAQIDKVLLFLHHTRAATPVMQESWYILQRQKRHMYLQSTHGGGVAGPSIMQRLPQPSKAQTQGWPGDEEEDEEEEEEEEEEDDDDETATGKLVKPNQTPTKKATQVKPPFVPFSRPGGGPSYRPSPVLAPTPAAPSARISAASSRVSTPNTASTQADGPPYKTVGRPRLETERQPDETEAQYFIRRAREGHRRIPDVTYIPPPQIPKQSKSGDASVAMWETVLHKHSHLKAKVEARHAASFTSIKASIKTERAKNDDKKGVKKDRKIGHKGSKEDDKEDRKEGKKEDKKAYNKDDNDDTFSSRIPDGKALSRWALRDWRDVVGAAALSGAFDDQVIARTAQRCADLFGQSIALNTMEMPARGDAPFKQTIYTPHEAHTASTATSNLKKANAEVQVRRAWKQRRQRLARREAIMAENASDDESEEEGEESDEVEEVEEEDSEDDAKYKGQVLKAEAGAGEVLTPQPLPPVRPAQPALASQPSQPAHLQRLASTPTRRISVVRGTAKNGVATVFYCPRPECDRAIDGFARRANVVRHLQLVHGLVVNTADIRQSSQGLGRDGSAAAGSESQEPTRAESIRPVRAGEWNM